MMKSFNRAIVATFLLIVSLSLSVIASNPQNPKGKGYELKITIHNLQDSLCYLYHHFGDKQRAVDTVVIGPKGECVFAGEEELDGGIYIVYVPDKVYFEVIVNEQFFTIETDTGDFISNMKITGSVENQMFNDYQRFRKVQYEKTTALKKRLDNNKSNKDSTKVINELMRNIGKETEEYTQGLFDKHADTFFAKVLKTTKPIEIPDPPKDAEGNIIDSSFALRYHQLHYFDNIDFSDDRLLRTPVFHQKVMDYLKLLTAPHPDSLIKSVDFILGKCQANEEIFRYMLATLYNQYNSSKIMGYDAVFVHIAEKYYVSGVAHWADSAFIADISKRIREITPTLIGEKAKNIVLVDTNGVRIPLYSVAAKYTILFFYEPDCGHCKKTAPKVRKVYDEFKEHGVEVYGVCTKTDIKEWKEFIHKFDLKWINVADPEYKSNFRNFFDVKSTPILYLLDEEKTIIAKRLGPEQMREVLARELGIELPPDEDADTEDTEDTEDVKKNTKDKKKKKAD